MKRFGYFLYMSALVAFGASASNTQQQSAVADPGFKSILESALVPLLAPSERKMQLHKFIAKSTLSMLGSFTSPEQVTVFEKLFGMSIARDEQLLEIYSRMKELMGKIDKQEDPEAEATMRSEMTDLIDRYKEVNLQRQRSAVEAGLLSAEALDGILAVPEIKLIQDSIDSAILAPFERYT